MQTSIDTFRSKGSLSLVNFAVFVPVGFSSTESRRLGDLLNSLFVYEPTTTHLIIVGDSSALATTLNRATPKTCKWVVVPDHSNGPHSLGSGIDGRHCAADTVALKYALQLPDIDFILKMDTDALVIGPFAQKVQNCFRSNRDAGILGVLGDSCDLNARSYHMDTATKERVDALLEIWRPIGPLDVQTKSRLARWGLATEMQLTSLAKACALLAPFLVGEFVGSHCQGGSYAVSIDLIKRMEKFGFLNDPEIWMQWPFGEDQMMGTICSAVGLKNRDLCCPSEPFGVQHKGLAFSPSELFKRGYSIIHSVKNDLKYTESYVRRFFKTLRHQC